MSCSFARRALMPDPSPAFGLGSRPLCFGFLGSLASSLMNFVSVVLLDWPSRRFSSCLASFLPASWIRVFVQTCQLGSSGCARSKPAPEPLFWLWVQRGVFWLVLLGFLPFRVKVFLASFWEPQRRWSQLRWLTVLATSFLFCRPRRFS